MGFVEVYGIGIIVGDAVELDILVIVFGEVNGVF